MLRCCEAITFNLIIHNKGRWAFVHLLFLEIIIILFISDQIMLFYTPESAKTRLGRHKPDLWIVTEDMTSQPNQPWRADRTTPVILITGNPDAVEIKKNSGKLTVLSMPLSIVDLRKTVEIYVS